MNEGIENFTPGSGIKRRDFLYVATAAFGAVGVAATCVPLIDQMNPSADVIAAGGPLPVALSSIAPGQQGIVRWQSKPVFIVHRTPEMLRELRQRSLLSRLSDPNSGQPQQPSYADNWSRSIDPNFLVVVGICTHLGCIPDFRPERNTPGLGADWPGGYLCPCHGSRYDLAGRVFSGMPAPFNLPVPPYRMTNDSMAVIGENPLGSTYSLSTIKQI